MRDTTAGSPAVRLSGLEIATHLVLGEEPSSPSLPAVAVEPRTALEAVVRRALERPPCVVSFSGGRDSSLLLAVAAHVARRGGLPPPVPATIRAPQARGSDESAWQERVVAHLGLDDWLRDEVTDELDFVGPVAQGALARHGLLYPAQAHFHVPLLRHAVGGTLLTGAGGDDVLDLGPQYTVRAAWDALRRGHDGTALRTLLRLGPGRVRRAYVQHRRRVRAPWLTPAAQQELDRMWRGELPPVASPAALAWTLRRRRLAALRDSLGALAVDAGAAIDHPLIDPLFVAAVARAAGWAGTGGRSRFLPRLAGDLLPRDVLLRRDKTSFVDVYWTSHSRELAMSWDGSGVDADVVNAEVLRATWATGRPNPATALLLQQVWLAGR